MLTKILPNKKNFSGTTAARGESYGFFVVNNRRLDDAERARRDHQRRESRDLPTRSASRDATYAWSRRSRRERVSGGWSAAAARFEAAARGRSIQS